MSHISDAPISNVTVYRKEFTRKTTERRPSYVQEPEYSNPITGPYEEHVLPLFLYKQLPEKQTRYPHPGEYASLVAEKYPTTRTFLRDPPGSPPDLSVIDKFYADENKSIYMVSYCKSDPRTKEKQEQRTGILPEGWEIPLTIQKCSYRDPRVLAPEGITQIKIKRPKENLAPNAREREILQVKTGESIYISDISNVGDEIIKGKLHGDVNVRPKFDQDELLKAKLISTN